MYVKRHEQFEIGCGAILNKIYYYYYYYHRHLTDLSMLCHVSVSCAEFACYTAPQANDTHLCSG